MRPARSRNSGMSSGLAGRISTGAGGKERIESQRAVLRLLPSGWVLRFPSPTSPLTAPEVATIVAAHFLPMKTCAITQAHPTKGSKIHRRGLAKKKGGIGQ